MPITQDAIDAAITSNRWTLDGQMPWLERLPLEPGASILDIGCGPGLHCEYFRQRGLRPVGMERKPELVQADVEHVRFGADLGGRTFRYVFSSHVLEHCRSPFEQLLRWKDLLQDGGELLLVVPPYSPLVSNDHWHIGWNVGQVAMLLVAAGFDCSGGIFMKCGHNVCGYGRKAAFKETGFNIEKSLPYLPAALARSLSDAHLPGEVAYVDATRIELA